MTIKRIKLEDLITRLEAANARELWVDVDELEPGVFKLPLSAIAAIATLDDGTLKARGDSSGYLEIVVKNDSTAPLYGWPGGVLTSLKRKCTNDGSNAGDQSVKIEPAALSPVYIHRIGIEHNDTSSRVQAASLLSSGGANPEYALFSTSAAASTPDVYPLVATGGASKALLLTSDFELVLSVAAVAVAKIGTFFVQYSYVGTPPTLTETGPTGSVFSAVS